MNAEQSIREFPNQFKYSPIVTCEDSLDRKNKIILVGMGGSHLAADLLTTANPGFPIIVYSDYGLPSMSPELLREHLVVTSSYSGNTEEVVSAFTEALDLHIPLAAMSVGGTLADLAIKNHVPFVRLPDTSIQPRSALGFSLLGLMKIINWPDISSMHVLAKILSSVSELCENKGKHIAKLLQGKIPIVYSSRANVSIAYIWKIKFNETGKVPAHYNYFPEVNHNEMTGYDWKQSNRELSQNYSFIFLLDSNDNTHITNRMRITKQLYEDRGFSVIELPFEGETVWERIFRSLLISDWVAYYTALSYGVEPAEVPMIEEFKKLIKKA